MGDSTRRLCYRKVLQPYVKSHEKNAGLLDDSARHKSDGVQKIVNDASALRQMIPIHYTGLLRTCDIGINRSLKAFLKKSAPH